MLSVAALAQGALAGSLVFYEVGTTNRLVNVQENQGGVGGDTYLELELHCNAEDGSACVFSSTDVTWEVEDFFNDPSGTAIEQQCIGSNHPNAALPSSFTNDGVPFISSGGNVFANTKIADTNAYFGPNGDFELLLGDQLGVSFSNAACVGTCSSFGSPTTFTLTGGLGDECDAGGKTAGSTSTGLSYDLDTSVTLEEGEYMTGIFIRVPDDNDWEPDEVVQLSPQNTGIGGLEDSTQVTVDKDPNDPFPTTEAPTTQAPPTTAPTTAPTMAVTGDPHLVGFGGQRYNFNGEDNQVYAFISDKKFQMNALLEQMIVNGVNGTWVTGISFVGADGETLTANPNRGLLLNRRMLVTETIAFGAGEVSVSFAKNGLLSSFHVVLEEYDITVVTQRGENVAYFDMIVSLRAEVGDVHGVLGQSARPEQRGNGDFKVEGQDADYVVKDGLLGTSCHFCRL